jgi:SAM-dependent methyltransferase
MRAFNKKELEYYDIFHKDKDYEAEAKALPLKGKTILEVGSGTGLMTKELRKLGYEVTTVDPNCEADYKYFEDVPDPEKFDNVLALYDVLNYMEEKPNISGWVIEMWDRSKGVKLFTYKKVDNCYRVRLGFKLFNKAHLLFIYWGKGFALAYHKLYL